MSPRCKKSRKCCLITKGSAFKPLGIPMTDIESIDLYDDELEAMRLCDVEGLTQEMAGTKMGVSRGTVQRLLETGRKKVIVALTEGKAITFKNHNTKEEVK